MALARGHSPLMNERRTERRSVMKTLITALALATLIIAPAFIQSATAAPNEGWEQSTQSPGGTYGGYPLREWYRTDKW